MSLEITLHLPVPRYIYKYLVAKYGENYAVKENDWFGKFILSSLVRKSDNDYEVTIPTDTKYPVTIKLYKAERNGFIISKRQGDEITKCIDKHFRDYVYTQAIMNYKNFGIDYKSTIISVLDSFGIDEDDLQYESLRKDFNRLKLEIEEKLENSIK